MKSHFQAVKACVRSPSGSCRWAAVAVATVVISVYLSTFVGFFAGYDTGNLAFAEVPVADGDRPTDGGLDPGSVSAVTKRRVGKANCVDNVDNWEQLRTFETVPSGRWIAWSPDGSEFVTGGGHCRTDEPGTVEIWDPDSGERRRSWLAGHMINQTAWSRDGSQIGTSGARGTVSIWDAESGERLQTLTATVPSVFSNYVGWSPDGSYVATGGATGAIKIWDSTSWTLIQSWTAHGTLFSIDWSPDGSRLVSAGLPDNLVKIWDVNSVALIHTLRGHRDWIHQVAWSPDGSMVASGSKDWTVKIWDAKTGRLVYTLTDFRQVVYTVAWSPDTPMLAAGGLGRNIMLWDSQSWAPIRTLTQDNLAWSVAWRPGACQLVAGPSCNIEPQRIVRLWGELEEKVKKRKN